MTASTLNQERARELFDAGLGCNAIARELGVDPATVSRWAKKAGLTFDRAKVAQANEVRKIDLAAGRIRLAEKMLAAAESMIDRIDEPYLVYNFGGADNSFNSRTLDDAPVEVKRNIITTAGITFDKLTRIVENTGGEADDAKSMLAQLGRALGIGAEPVDNSGS